MATCNDCLYQPICDAYSSMGITDVPAGDITPCVLFKSKSDVAEVKHGEWVDRDGKTWCSLCEASNKQYKPPYCPHCGAKMDGGEVK